MSSSGSICRRLAVAAALLRVLAGQCEPQWVPGDPGASPQGSVHAVVNWDPDGVGPASAVLVAVGQFSIGSSQSVSVATWDGSTWTLLGVPPIYRATATAVYNGELIVAGDGKVVRWNGTSWQQIAVHTSPNSGNEINCMLVFGGELYVAGRFATIGGAAASHIARWNGTSWNPCGAGLLSTPSIGERVFAMAVHTYGGVAGIYVGGDFSTAGGQSSPALAFWNGSMWTPLSAGGTVRTLVARSSTSPSTSYLFVGGTMATLFGVPVDKAARYNSSTATVTPLTGFPGTYECRAMFVRNVGPSSYELVAGEGPQLWRWTGSAWNTVGPSLSTVEAETVATYLSTPRISSIGFYGGRYILCSATFASLYGGVFDYDGVTWRRLYGEGLGDRIYTVLPVGDQFVIGGSFRSISGVPMNGVAIGTPGNWQPLGNGLIDGSGAFPGTAVLALARLPGGDLVAGGTFSPLNGGAHNYIARWDGSAWQAMAGGMDSSVRALTVLANGALVAGGDFWMAGSTPASRVARWSGSYWSDLAGGLDNQVHALTALPNGDLVAGGAFSVPVGGSPVTNRVARWDGTAWQAMGAGFDGYVRALAVEADGSVLACGSFENSAGTVVDNIARWDGSAWQAMPAGIQSCRTMYAIAAMPNGDVVVGGLGGFTPSGWDLVARLRGTSWQAMQVGNWSSGSTPDMVRALALTEDGDLVLGGAFHRVGNLVSGNFATLSPTCPASAVAYGAGCAGSGGLDVLTATSLPWIGASYRAHGAGLPPLGFCASVFGFTPTALPLQPLLPQALPGCMLLAAPDLVGLQLVNGAVDVATPIPPTLAIVGLPLQHQLVTIELGPAGQFVAVTSSNGLALTIGAL